MLEALFAALLFGASAPIAKALLGAVNPIPLAGFLYLGSGVALVCVKGIQRLRGPSTGAEARIRSADVPWLAGAVLAGGVAAPIVLLFGLRGTSAAVASLLLNFEGVATCVIAALLFGEAIGRRAAGAIVCITLASLLLSWNPSGQIAISLGALGILAACTLWGIDNNLTRNISAKDPLAIVAVKGLAAGSVSLLLALGLGNRLPALGNVLGSMVLGSLSYGLSLVLFVRAMRTLGAARTSAFLGTAPLAGVVLSLLLFRETPGAAFVVALPLMAGGAFLLLNEQHRHLHVHAPAAHEHRHYHGDSHHTHGHEDTVDDSGSHSHLHRHEILEHEHPHTPDIHHRHSHASKE
jgi:drug/metabolite transporter (DMT)-like permease